MAGGTLVYTENATLTTDDEGLFNHLIGTLATNADPEHTLSPSDFVTSDPVWVEIEIGGTPLLPRSQLVTVPYAMAVGTVDGASGGTVSGDVSISGGNLGLANSSAGAGNILKGGNPFIHNFGTYNVFIGRNAGNFTMTGQRNTACGYYALQYNTTGSYNTASGTFALNTNTTGVRNTAIGQAALDHNSSGDKNTASGSYALQYNTTGDDNTAGGYYALRSNTTGTYNTAVGSGTLDDNTTGSFNTAVGYAANVSVNNLTNATAIGCAAIVNASDKIRLGNTTVSVIEGQVPYTFTSDKNDKENFRPVDGDDVLGKIRGLDLTSWNYIGHDPQQFRHYGPVAHPPRRMGR